MKPSADVHVGLAIAMRGGGLVTPAIHDVDKNRRIAARQNPLVRKKRFRGGRVPLVTRFTSHAVPPVW